MPTITTAGAVPIPPLTLNAELIAEATALSPGLTANLPGSLIEDMSSTSTGAAVLMDAACVDLVNSISPLTANPFILAQLGDVYGVQQGVGVNTSVVVVFTGVNNIPGYVIPAGFIVSDGTYQYVSQEAGVIASDGQSGPVYCIASQSGSWAIPANTVTTLQTSVPIGYEITVTNPGSGTPASGAQTNEDFQAQVIQAGQAVSTGIGTLVKTTIEKVSGVQPRLVSFRQTGGGWQVLVGGGDPYQVAAAIYLSLFNFIDLQPASSTGTTQTIAITDFPDTYSIVFVEPALSTVAIAVTWDTITSASFVDPNVVTSLAQPALVSYVNSIYVGQPMSLLALQDSFVTSVASVIPESSISQLQFVVRINGTIVNPPSGGVLISGDPESYFFTSNSNIVVTKA